MAEEKVEEKKPEVVSAAAGRAKLSSVVREAWSAPELKGVRANLEDLGKTLSSPYHKAAIDSGFDKLLRETAEKLKLRELMKSAWGITVEETE